MDKVISSRWIVLTALSCRLSKILTTRMWICGLFCLSWKSTWRTIGTWTSSLNYNLELISLDFIYFHCHSFSILIKSYFTEHLCGYCCHSLDWFPLNLCSYKYIVLFISAEFPKSYKVHKVNSCLYLFIFYFLLYTGKS